LHPASPHVLTPPLFTPFTWTGVPSKYCHPVSASPNSFFFPSHLPRCHFRSTDQAQSLHSPSFQFFLTGLYSPSSFFPFFFFLNGRTPRRCGKFPRDPLCALLLSLFPQLESSNEGCSYCDSPAKPCAPPPSVGQLLGVPPIMDFLFL